MKTTGVVAACGALLAGACGAVIVNGYRLNQVIPFWAAFTLVTGLAAFVAARSLKRCWSSLRAHHGVTNLPSALVALAMLIAVSLSGVQLATGARTSKLAEIGFTEVSPRTDVTADFFIFSLALLGFAIGEWLADQVVARKPQQTDARRVVRFETRQLYFTLVVLALVSFALQHGHSLQDTFATRGQTTGQGPETLLAYSAPLAVVVGVLRGHWGSVRLVALSTALMIATVALGGTRTPLMIVGVALLVHLIDRAAALRRPLLVAGGVIILAYVALVLIVGISQWRGDVASGQPASLGSSLVSSASDPINKLSAGGLDTLDGLSLATKVNRSVVGASVLDPLKAIIGFVPHQLYPDKPQFLGPIVTHDYTDFGGNAGIFLSGPGYGLIVFGGRVAMTLMFVVIGFACEAICRRQSAITVWTALVTYFAVRFVVAGDAFDLFHVLGLSLVYAFAYCVLRFWQLWMVPLLRGHAASAVSR